MNRLPAWMGALANLLYLQLEGVMLVAWSWAGFKSLQSLDISSCNVVQVESSWAHFAKAFTQGSVAEKMYPLSEAKDSQFYSGP